MRKVFLIATLLIFAFSAVRGGEGDDYYVAANTGSNTTGDGSQSNPWMTVSYALAQLTGPGDLIHVAAGIYDTLMDGTWYEVFPINLKDGVSLMGEDSSTTIIDACLTAPVFKGQNIGSQTIISNFTIRNGKSINYGMSRETEGNISLSNSDLIIRNNIIEGGKAYFEGAGIQLDGGSPQIINNVFQNNTCGSYGGVINVTGTSSVIINGNIFLNNTGGMTSYDGGAIAFDYSIYGGSPVVSNNLISQTVGPGISILSENYYILIINNTIVGNTWSGIYLEYGGTGEVINNIIADN